MKYYAIIVGGGSGKRMQNTIAKQFLLLKNKPVLMHTLSAFYASSFKPEIILVLHADLHQYWEELCMKYNFDIPHVLIRGGEQRFHSVRNGLMTIKGEGIVAVHDAVRPLVSSRLIAKAYEIAEDTGNAVSCIKPSDSVRRVKENSESKVINRDELVLIQTPQTFEISQLRTAYQQHYKPKFTDDASVVEKAGFKINLIEGERNNLKITYPEDLELANLLLK
ncbi:2-C-methyl-D-erythritol 4-phosphate cytidylyltransferase [Pedobacter sp. LMG 31464]|uniref:2-C-methyl-D-erythritol 4-phosphate cytidylyltransferase n=1 Tax=Pedobacter planticolens TaxID=2679964 RepID=A0A923IUL1_9SPHI|nr:2-C-methyl-D-erythritol 4-phosphate cytidylyltransferase [Pedobacter planticolens]MBB2145006.1 2-C-methyl-D-erythritol 4-phosphate cytidylyltransferase [Pedobacter planticolens]